MPHIAKCPLMSFKWFTPIFLVMVVMWVFVKLLFKLNLNLGLAKLGPGIRCQNPKFES